MQTYRSPLKSMFKVIALLVLCVSISGCGALPFGLGGDDEGIKVRIKSVPLKIVLAAGNAALQIAAEEYLGVQIDVNDLLRQVAGVDIGTGVPPTDIPVLMVVDKKTNDILYWRLTENVKMIRLKHDMPGEIELKVMNESPLRIELWIAGDVENIDVTVELRE